jgi:hypothetical protein
MSSAFARFPSAFGAEGDGRGAASRESRYDRAAASKSPELYAALPARRSRSPERAASSSTGVTSWI